MRNGTAPTCQCVRARHAIILSARVRHTSPDWGRSCTPVYRGFYPYTWWTQFAPSETLRFGVSLKKHAKLLVTRSAFLAKNVHHKPFGGWTLSDRLVELKAVLQALS